MSLASELAALYRRDLARLLQELRAFPAGDTIWRKTPGMTNSPGNLTLHLEGNLREFIGRLIGNVAYTRRRDAEFALSGQPVAELIARIDEVSTLIPSILGDLTSAALDADYPQPVLGSTLTVRQFIIHLNGHLNYHLGQIDAQRRALTGVGAIDLAGL